MDKYQVPPTEPFSNDNPHEFYGEGGYRYKVGDEIGGRFFVHNRAHGSFGEVFFCYDREREYFYALKTFRFTQKALDDPHTLPRWRREVDKWIALGEHDHIVQCFALEIINNIPFLLLEWVADDDLLCRHFRNHHENVPMFLDWYARLGRRGLALRSSEAIKNRESAGTTLFNWIHTHKRLPLHLAVRFALDICAGVRHAQRVHPGFVHCDLKPSNILITEQSRAKVTDFGTVRVIQELLDFRMPRGTELYMAPEQWDGASVDTRTDIYAIGCTLFEMIAGHAPFGTPARYHSSEELRFMHEQIAPPALGGGVPEDARHIVEKCLQKRPQDRFSSVEELIDALTTTYSSLFGNAPQTAAGMKPQSIEEINQAGITYYNLDKYEQALACFARAAELDATYPNTYTNRGCVYHVMGQHEAALADYTQAVRLGRSSINAKVRNNRGLLYLALSQPRRALSDLYKSVEIDPQYASVYVNLGLTYILLGDYDKALSAFDRAIELDAIQVLAYHNRGYVYQYWERQQDALSDYTKALELDPFLLQGYINRSLVYTRLGRYVDADRDRNQAAYYHPDVVIESESLVAAIQFGRPAPQSVNVGRMNMKEPFRIRRNEKRKIDKMLGDRSKSKNKMPLHSIVYVNNVEYAEWLHESIAERQNQGERVTQVSLKIRVAEGDFLEDPLPEVDECQLLVDQDAMLIMGAEGMATIYDLNGRRLILDNDNPDDPWFPQRLWNVS